MGEWEDESKEEENFQTKLALPSFQGEVVKRPLRAGAFVSGQPLLVVDVAKDYEDGGDKYERDQVSILLIGGEFTTEKMTDTADVSIKKVTQGDKLFDLWSVHDEKCR